MTNFALRQDSRLLAMRVIQSSIACAALVLGLPLISAAEGPAQPAQTPVNEPGKIGLQDPQKKTKMPDTTRVVPYKQNGQVVGLKFSNIAPKSSFGRAGLKNNDVVKMLNGTPITSYDQASKIIAGNKKVTAVVLRNDETIKFDLNQPNYEDDQGHVPKYLQERIQKSGQSLTTK